MSRRNLLLCFDAFGTLFAPKQPVPRQYADIARATGIGNFTNHDIEKGFRAAFKDESARHPNYGKASGLDATKWWTNVIRNTFEPLIGLDERITRDLAPRLLHRFATADGYLLYPDVQRLFKRLHKDLSAAGFERLVVGVVTNSDDRVPDVLSSLGLRVAPQRYKDDVFVPTDHAYQSTAHDYDIDFCVMSYDVGAEKPDKAIFAAALQMLARSTSAHDTMLDEWHKVYVGDDYRKDVAGALAAGWKAVYIHREDSIDSELSEDIMWLDQVEGSHQLLDCFAMSPAVGIRSMDELDVTLNTNANGQ